MKVTLVVESGKIKKVTSYWGHQSSDKGMPQVDEEIRGLDPEASGEMNLDLVRVGDGSLAVRKEIVAQTLSSQKLRLRHLRRRR